MTFCPLCNSTTVGKIGSSQYYCWTCCYEFAIRQQGIVVFGVEEDGALTDMTAKVLPQEVL